MADRIRRQKNYELFASAIQDQIARGELPPGHELEPERELMKMYQLGRSSVREALRILESRGLIEQRTTGFVVAERDNPLSQGIGLLIGLNEVDTLQVLELRETLEAAIARFAAARRSDEDLKRIGEAVEETAAGLAAEERQVDAGLPFHLAVARAGGNPLFEYVMLAVRGALRRSLLEIHKIPPIAERAIVDHRAILVAIAEGDEDKAEAAMRRHLTGAHNSIRSEVNKAVAAGNDGG